MGKKCLLFDEAPERCYLCPFSSYTRYFGSMRCSMVSGREVHDYSKRPDWCPIMNIPEKKAEWEMDLIHHESLDLGRRLGWNECIDTLLKGKEDRDE